MKLFLIAIKSDRYPVFPRCADDALTCARKYSGCDVVALSNYSQPGWADINPYFETSRLLVESLARVTNASGWGRECPAILRWYVMREYIKAHNVTEPIVNCDWDMLVFQNLPDSLSKWNINSYDLADCFFSEGHPPVVNSAPYVVNNLEAIGMFCDLVTAVINAAAPILGPGAGSDMGWWYWTRRVGGYSNVNLAQEFDDEFFDGNISCDLDVYMDDGHSNKKVTMQNGKPFFTRRKDSALIKALCLHCFCGYRDHTEQFIV